jgi:uncharacterized protein YbbC (DUF1343 family)
MLKTGLDRLRDADFAPLHGKRVGLVTHPAAVSGFDGYIFTAPPRTALELFANHPAIQLTAVFGPEHGLTGEAQDLIPVKDERRGSTPPSFRLYSLYGDTFDSLKPTPEMLAGLDVLVIDLQDVGSRYYTFQATMLYCMEACAAIGLPVIVLDRPNPITAMMEGPTIAPGFESFVGPHPIPIRHGLTMGELAKLYKAERVPNVELEVIECEGYRGRELYNFCIPPSPNMPTARTALVYPGMCLIEGTNLSEGRGTTSPFETVGYPGVNANAITKSLRDLELQFVDFLPATFTPTFQKHAGQSCGGVKILVTDAYAYQAVLVGLAVIVAFRNILGDAFRWRTETYEFVSHIPAIDLLFGSDRERKAIEAEMPLREIIEPWQAEIKAFEKRIG